MTPFIVEITTAAAAGSGDHDERRCAERSACGTLLIAARIVVTLGQNA